MTPKIIPEDDIDACGGNQMLGIFVHKLFAWADNTEAGLTKIKGASWIGCSTNRWITERRPWGKKVKFSKHQFERMLARGRKMGVLATCQWPSRFENWKTVLHVRPADGYMERRTRAAQRRTDAGSMQGFCGTHAGRMQNPDQDLETISETKSVTGIGVPAGADNAITPPACATGEELEAIASSGGSSPLPPVPPPPLSNSVTPKQLWKAWVDACDKHHDMKLERATAKQMGQLRRVIDVVLTRDLDPVTFANTVIAEWNYYARQVRQRTDDVQFIQDTPHLGFATRFLEHLISIMQDDLERRIEESRNDDERKLQRVKNEAERDAARLAWQHTEEAELDAVAKQGAEFTSRRAAVQAMYRCLGRGNAVQSIQGQSIRAFLSSWGGDEQLDDAAVCAKYRRDLGNAMLDYCEDEKTGDEQQPVTSSVVPFPNAA